VKKGVFHTPSWTNFHAGSTLPGSRRLPDALGREGRRHPQRDGRPDYIPVYDVVFSFAGEERA
jgi:hypothetical protein